MSCGIYKIINQINNKVYIGKAGNIERRWYEHRSDAKNPNKTYHLYQAMRKYGLDNFIFEIIEECPPDNDILSEREKYWINYYDSYNNGYNETLGGEGKLLYDIQEIKQLWDDGFCNKEICLQLGCSEHTVYDALRNYENYTSEESHIRGNQMESRREQLREEALKRFGTGPVYQYSLDGNYIQEFDSMASAANALGKTMDHSIYKALNYKDRSNMAYGFLWSKEKVDKIPPYKLSNGKQVRNINTGKIFLSIRQAAEWAGIDKEGIRRALNGTRKSAGKMKETNEPLYWEKLE